MKGNPFTKLFLESGKLVFCLTVIFIGELSSKLINQNNYCKFASLVGSEFEFSMVLICHVTTALSSLTLVTLGCEDW